jgi:hypothetical protein
MTLATCTVCGKNDGRYLVSVQDLTQGRETIREEEVCLDCLTTGGEGMIEAMAENVAEYENAEWDDGSGCKALQIVREHGPLSFVGIMTRRGGTSRELAAELNEALDRKAIVHMPPMFPQEPLTDGSKIWGRWAGTFRLATEDDR